KLVTGFARSIAVALGDPGGATLGGTSAVAAVGGVATFFDLSIKQAGAGYTLVATASGMGPVSSAAFDVTPGPATRLGFTVQPTTTVAGQALTPAVRVTALDAVGNPVPGFTDTVTIAFGNNPGGGTLRGTTSAVTVNGVASFADLAVTKTGTSYWLKATAPGLGAATSFDLSINRTGVGYTVTASAAGVSAPTSAAFDITPGTATQLTFIAQPTTTVAGRLITPALQVIARDPTGNPVPGFTGTVT